FCLVRRADGAGAEGEQKGQGRQPAIRLGHEFPSTCSDAVRTRAEGYQKCSAESTASCGGGGPSARSTDVVPVGRVSPPVRLGPGRVGRPVLRQRRRLP